MLFLAAGSIYGQKLDLIHYNRREEIVIFVYTQTSIFNSLRVIMSQSLKAVSFNIAWQESFKEIQCYEDKQVNQVLRALLSDKELISVIKSLFKSDENQAPIQFERLADIHSIDAFQAWVAESIFPYIETSYDDLSVSGLDELDPATPYVFISNHRDIVMDPLILNKALREYGFSTSNCAIGDNLLQHPAANDLALLNRCFKVFRSLKSPRAMLKAMKTQSEYIRYLHFTQQGNVWIAQKEGRAKDNIDKTNPALIKMLILAKPKERPFSDYMNALNIVPVCFSYEWDPCDIDKAHELINSENNSDYQKDRFDDFISCKKGLSEEKGKIHIDFGNTLSISETHDHKDVANLIDEGIQKAYRPFPVNYASYKRIHATHSIPSNFSKQEINQSAKRLDERLKDENIEIQKRVYTAYSQVLNS
ncbi:MULTISPECIES: 1-acyl-sn-glycerol-3-phosphate acyltransferase [unclassified Oleiphilus]|uniref:1-acyl-sn-glycerol-3-phosphate acyltransferase n=5 Tax=Oleiphilus TaxID=141450 RepID=UPI0007C2A3F7|nr:MULTISPECIES: 1-acyl-sn-glycerol-3-phosphate acyltransferase [unclassified Oleiphilus]KZY45332.1 hypothetical protein A3732_01310 [Oleiphilus sp. HI0050]KZY77193.1 hypothetical protein A3740_10915 [Oleiphilus sp. HI0068]KZY86135.1 hypothetical protein A3743_17555 [Oleiphilus sp. HI0072]KZY87558.1 hypothetical protein A3741_13525 [Oleiphilus sp. HI0069]KZY33355.1 hypothetical protein A3729_06485 [Oleiphilus sp. HI0043]